MRARAFGLSDVGRRRETNEDAFLVEPRHDLYVIADGMGGYAAGEVASRIAVDSLREALARPGDGVAAARLQDAVHAANERICDSQSQADQSRMGTTLVAMMVEDQRAIIGHVGDSRAYLLREGRLERLTSDHSWVNEQVKLGLMSDEAAQKHPMRNIVTRALGSRTEVAAEVREEGVRAGDVFLLCSDGLNTMLPDEEIQRVLERLGRDPEQACRELVTRANESGGEDNTTVVVVHVEG
jgi:serine/threonine protein phosphatase PrpC